MYLAAALEAEGGIELLRGGVIAARQQLEAVERVYFLAVFLRKNQHFACDALPAIIGADIGFSYLGHEIFTAKRLLQLNADKTREFTVFPVSNNDHFVPVRQK